MSAERLQASYETYWNGAFRDPELGQLVPERKQQLRPILARLPRGARILDVGCGDGVFTQFFAECGLEPMGTDIAEAGVRWARAHYPQLRFEVASLDQRLPFDDGAFDALWCSEVIEHLFDVDFALGEMRRILKPNGLLLLTTPYHGLAKNLLIVLRNFDHHFDPQGLHIRFFTRTSLFRVLNAHGLAVEQMTGIGRRYPFWMSHFVVARAV